ncbi:MAG: hypothetical protein CFE38_07020, partial [Comamonadaceae bacterium PBBC1]
APVLADTALSFANVAQTATPVAPTGAVGVLVSSLMGGVTDADTADGKGMAITGADTAHGTLYYSTNGGTTWTAVDTTTALSDARAFLIGSDADNRLYFKPNADYAGTSNALTFRAWDKTAGGTEASFTNITATGGTTAFSAATDTVAQTVPMTYVTPTPAVSGLGNHVAGVGDVNGDGYDDFAIDNRYVVFGSSGALTGLTATDLTNGSGKGFYINLTNSSNYYFSAAGAGDINGDGMSDLILASSATGAAYVVYGKTGSANVDIAQVAAGIGGFAISNPAQALTFTTSSAGDVNGDGLVDILMTTNENTVGAKSYVIYGKTNSTAVSLASLSSTDGYAVTYSNLLSAANAGDVNGDGLADTIVGQSFVGQGTAYVNFGNSAGASTSGFTISGASTVQGAEQVGWSVAGAGDVNGDGLADLLVGTKIGRSYVVFGKTGTANVDLSNLLGGSPTGGFAILPTAIGDYGTDTSGYSSSYAGDLNGDGLADLLVASGLADPTGVTNGGKVYVVYGKTDATAVNLTAIAAGSGGFVINGSVSNGLLGGAQGGGWGLSSNVSNAGDLNGDGYDDLVVSTDSLNTSNPNVYVIYGGPQFISGNVALATGTSADEYVAGTSGADTLIGNGGVDRFSAGKGNDTVVLQASDATNLANTTIGGSKAMVDGGTGFDTLQVSAAGVNLDMTAISNAGGMASEGQSRINSIERIDMGADATANTLTIAAKDVNDMADFNSIHTGTASDDGKTWTNVGAGTALSATTQFHQVVVEGTAADTLNLSAGFTLVGTVFNGTANYNVYQNTATHSQVIADSAITNVVIDLPPTLLSTSPADNGQVAATSLANNLTLTFSEAVKAGTGLIELYNASGTLVESFNAATGVGSAGGVVTWNTSTLTLNPFANLTAGTGYYVKVAATAVTDLAGNAYAGITDATT